MKSKMDPKNEYNEEVSLVEIIQVLITEKLTIFKFIAIVMIIVTGVSFFISSKEIVTASISPGLLGLINGKLSYIDEIETIKFTIDEGMLNSKILSNLNLPQLNKSQVLFKTTSLSGANALKLSLETENVEQGLLILRELISVLDSQYEKKINALKLEIDRRISLDKSELNKLQIEYDELSKASDNSDTLFGDLSKHLIVIEKNYSKFNSSMMKELSKNSEIAPNKALILSNISQQNLQYINNIKNILESKNSIISKKVDLREGLSFEITQKKNDIHNLSRQKEELKGIRIIQNPEIDISPRKPVKLLLFLFAFIFSFFTSIAFVLIRSEYLKKING
ncbi:MAG: hypothetical protein H6625_03900 [Bdellovibrionaceae bacterium]|nr:hypothetical protein [Pseudobdellovibrionaceae bacterium]